MSWQDGLRQLDEELASGQISADEYRARRDRILSSAVAPQDPPTTHVPAVQPPPAQPSDEADRTQQVSGWQPQRPDADADRTQVVPGVPTQAGLGGQPPRPAPNMFPSQYDAPPWEGNELPPLAPTASPDWIRQGPEVFEAERGGKGVRILLIVLAIVVVAGIGVGSYFLFLNKDDSEAGADPTNTQSTPSPTSTQPPKDDLSTAELPGKTEDHGDITTFTAAQESKFLTEDEIAIYTEAGAGKSRLVAATTDDKVHVLIFTTEATSPEAAGKASTALADQQLIYGMTEGAGAPPNVQVGEFPGNEKTPATIRAHYAHKGTIVRIQVNGDDLDNVTSVFEDLVDAQLEVLDANG